MPVSDEFLDGMDQTLAFPDHALLQPQINGMVSSAVMRIQEVKRL